MQILWILDATFTITNCKKKLNVKTIENNEITQRQVWMPCQSWNVKTMASIVYHY